MDKTDQNGVYCFVIPKQSINDLQINSMRRVVKRAKHAHWTDVDVKINGKSERFQADWIKHLSEIQLVNNLMTESAELHAVLDRRGIPRQNEAGKTYTLTERVNAWMAMKTT